MSSVRAMLTASGCFWQPARRGREEVLLATDIDIGTQAHAACHALAAAAHTFTWHGDQHEHNRTGWPSTLPGMS